MPTDVVCNNVTVYPTGDYVCTCPSYWFEGARPYCALHNPGYGTGWAPGWSPPTVTQITWPPVPQRLSDEDVDRIARRVIELQREERARENHDPGDE